MKINWSKWQTIIQIPIVVIMGWATLESYIMRKTSQEQTIKNTMPILVIDVNTLKKYSLSIPIIRNVGFGPAFNVEFTDLQNRELKLQFQKISGIQKDAELPLNYYIFDTANHSERIISSDSSSFLYFLNYRGQHFMGRRQGQELGKVKITYTDIVGKGYTLSQSLYYDWSNDKLYFTIMEFPKAQ